jgi:mannobiose 2-epimerase
MDHKLKEFLNELDHELKVSILPYWMKNMVDHDNGGYYGRIDGKDRLHPKAAKGSVLNARILWTFSAAYNYYMDPKYLLYADRAFKYCTEYFINDRNDGVYWLVNYNGKPVEAKNQIYALSFMAYGFSEYHIATQNEKALEICRTLFRSIEKYSFDPEFNGYLEAFDQDWTLLEDLRLSDQDANAKKTMNTHLHILEAYTNMFRICPNEELRQQLINIINVFIEKIIDPDTLHFRLFFDEKWQPMDNEISYGHDIEGSWLLQEAAEIAGDDSLIARAQHIALQMVEAVRKDGFDEDGGLFYELKSDGTMDTDKHWWPQAEAMVALVNAYQISQDNALLDQAIKVWQFVKEKIIDKEGGEWHYRVDQQGMPYTEEDKAGFWKCPYHNSRACLEILKRLG